MTLKFIHLHLLRNERGESALILYGLFISNFSFQDGGAHETQK